MLPSQHPFKDKNNIMIDFSFYSPTEFVFGRGAEKKTGQLAKHYGASKALIVYGGGSAVKSGLLARVAEALDSQGIAHFELGGIQPNPTDDKVYQGIDLVRANGIDFLLAVGGGSVIDTAKAIACGSLYDGDFFDFYLGKADAQGALPVGVVLTIPAAGSEGSCGSVITKVSTQQKLGYDSPAYLRPKFAVMNPELTMTLPEWQTFSGVTDMIVHVLERYFSNTENTEITDRLCEGVIAAVMTEARKLVANPMDYEARANIMWSGTVAHTDICGLGRVQDWTSHNMEHELSALYNVTHGAGLAVVAPAYMTFMAKHNPRRIVQFAKRVMNVASDFGTDEQIALEGVRLFKAFLTDIHMPVTLAQLGVENPDIPALVAHLHANQGQQFGNFYPMTPQVSEEIYKLCL